MTGGQPVFSSACSRQKKRDRSEGIGSVVPPAAAILIRPAGAGHQNSYLLSPHLKSARRTICAGAYIMGVRKGRGRMFRRGGGCTLLGICAAALGAGILIAAIFPVGALMFLVAFLLIACGCACCRR